MRYFVTIICLRNLSILR